MEQGEHRQTPNAGMALVVIALLLATALPADAVRVQPSRDTLPHGLYGYGAATVDGTAYLVGGSLPDRAFSDEIIALGPDGSTSVVAHLPQPLLEPGVAAFGDDVYIFGGATQPQQGGLPTTTDKIYVFHADSKQTEELIGTTLPEAVSSTTAVRLGAYIYLAGGLEIQEGTDGGSVDWVRTVARFDPSGPSITTMELTLPTGRGQMAGAALDGSVLLVGGMIESGDAEPCPDDRTTCQSRAILRLRPEGTQGSLGRVASTPERIRWTAIAQHEDTVYLLGGCRSNCGGHFGTDAIVEIDTTTMDVTTIPVTMPLKGGRNQAVVFDGVATVAGGVRANGSATATHDRLMRIELGATAPWAPRNVTIGPGEDGSVRLAWQAPAYDGGAGITNYRVLRSQGAAQLSVVDRTSQTTYVDENVEVGETYRYQIRAVNPSGVGSGSTVLRFTPSDTPDAPQVTARGGDEKVVVQWSPPEDTGGSPLTGYRLVGYPAGTNASPTDCDAATCRDLQPGTLYFPVKNLDDGPIENGQTYVFHVLAQNENGWGPPSPPAEATAQPVPDPPTELRHERGLVDGEPVVNLTWRSVHDADAYVVHRGTSIGELNPLDTTDILTFTDDQDVPRGVEILYAVAAKSGDREGPLSKAIHVVFPEPPGPVRNLTSRWTGSQAVLGWRVPASTGGGQLLGYDVARTRGAIDPEEAGADPVRIKSTTYEDATVPRGGPVTYHVRGVTKGGPGPWEMTQLRVPSTRDTERPEAVLAARPSEADVGAPVIFDASGSVDDEGIAAYRFDFGDGAERSWSSNPRTAHRYTEPGVYEAQLTVRDVSGLESDPATATIAVGPPPETPDDGNQTPPDDGNGLPVPTWLPLAALAGAALAARVRRRGG